jgi:hypothetical protein
MTGSMDRQSLGWETLEPWLLPACPSWPAFRVLSVYPSCSFVFSYCLCFLTLPILAGGGGWILECLSVIVSIPLLSVHCAFKKEVS